MKISKVLGEAIDDLEQALAAAREASSTMVAAHEAALTKLRAVKERHDHAMAELAGDTPVAPVQPPAPPVVATPPSPPPEPVAPAPVVPAPTVPVKPPVPVAPPAGPVPVGSDRVIPDAVWAAVDQYAPAEKVNPDVLLAIEVWETGWFMSDAWRYRRNPGGMKAPPASFAAHGLVTDRDPEHPTYMRFATWQDGIRGHSVFIGEGPRYAAIHATADPDRQIEAIGAAGYAEGSNSWLVGVKAKYRQVVALRAKRAGTRPSATPVTTDLGALILASAKRAQDLGTSFPYDPQTEAGNLGCANAVSWILTDAGVLKSIVLNVDGLYDALIAVGWKETTTPYEDGDVILWKKWTGSGGHQHCGILDEEGAVVWAINNSSGQRRVVVENLAGDPRPIRCVLRHP